MTTHTLWPTLDSFRALSLRERADVFLQWAKTMPADERYIAHNDSRCALSRFGTILTGLPSVIGGNYGLHLYGESIQVLPSCRPDSSPIHPIEGDGGSTYGALVARLEQRYAEVTKWVDDGAW